MVTGYNCVLMATLRSQVRNNAGKRVRERYYLPTAADTGTRTLYKFLEQHSPNGIDFYPDALQQGEEQGYLPREKILDRHGQHVQHCKSCSVRFHNHLISCLSVCWALESFSCTPSRSFAHITASACIT